MSPNPDPVASPIDRLVEESRVLVVVGPGGVGKTTTAAALGLRAAREGKKVLVLTIDPARRLADVLGLDPRTQEPILVPIGPGPGRLWAMMVDMGASWDQLVHRCAPNLTVADELVNNALYRALTTNFIQSHDYIALDHLVDLVELEADPGDKAGYDLVVVDTPPSGHVLDLIDAPERMSSFFDSRLLSLLTSQAGGGLFRSASRPFELVADALLGTRFLGRISSMFVLLAQLGPQFNQRAARLGELLSHPDTSWVAVRTPGDDWGLAELVAGLRDRGLDLDLTLVNRSLTAAVGPGGDGTGQLQSQELAEAVEQWADLVAAEAEREADLDAEGVIPLAYQPGGIDGLEGLAALFIDTLFTPHQ